MRTTSSALTGKSSRARPAWATYAGLPSTAHVPAITGSSPSRSFRSVVFPPPLGPRTASASPASSENVTPLSAGRPGA